jgi:hypothetical protein
MRPRLRPRRRFSRTTEVLLACAVVLVAVGAGLAALGHSGRYGRTYPDDPRVHREFDPVTGQLIQLIYDASGNHKADTWSYFANGKVVRTEVDEDEDGKIDTWYYYNANEEVEKTGFSTQKDGVVDAWRYETPDGALTRIEYSSARDGVVTRRDFYEHNAVVRTEAVK